MKLGEELGMFGEEHKPRESCWDPDHPPASAVGLGEVWRLWLPQGSFLKYIKTA